MVAIREGALEPPNSDAGGDAFEFDNNRDPDKDDERGTLVITIDDDLHIPDVELKDLPPPLPGKRSKPKDTSTMDKWLLNWEASSPGAKIDTVRKKEVIQVRSHADVAAMVDRAGLLSKKASIGS